MTMVNTVTMVMLEYNNKNKNKNNFRTHRHDRNILSAHSCSKVHYSMQWLVSERSSELTKQVWLAGPEAKQVRPISSPQTLFSA